MSSDQAPPSAANALSPVPAGRVLIIGGGPTGLGAAYRLRELGHADFHLCERNAHLGGLAHSFRDERGFTWDIGGHVLFSHYEYYDRVFERLMGPDFTLNSRESWVRLMGRWVPYPFQNNIRYLPPEAALECLSGLIQAQGGLAPGKDDRGRPRRAAPLAASEARNFSELIDAAFGEGIARIFMRPYNWKVWAHPPEMMGTKWIGERVAMIDVHQVLGNVILGRDDYGWGPNNRFKFPLGGTGDFYDRFAPILEGRFTLNAPVREVDSERRRVRMADGSESSYDALISTMPLDILVAAVIKGPVPDRVRAAAARLRHSGGHMVGVGIRRPCPSTKSWMYFPESDCPFYRVTYLSNYSPRMTPDPARHYSLLCETSESEFKPVDRANIVEDTIRGLENAGLLEPGERADIVSTWHHFAPYAYPTPTVDRDDILSEVIPWLEARGIYSRGRFGMWKYEVSNTDHSLMQGVEVVNRLLLGEPEKTVGIVYRVTDDGRQAADHERSVTAGSGEKRGAGGKPEKPRVVVVGQGQAARRG